ncbi:MAG: hypothetical protein AMJ81_03715 [Phycisphaerae bacterium SM23_33]|nr:MAG: hypothetical protein AMJ81_03715 [Phycisphaerae bacterium SM23_33]
MDSRERMLTAIGGGRADHVPLCFMIFAALRARTSGWRDFVETSLAMGLDAVVDLGQAYPGRSPEHSDAPGVPLHFGPEVSVREWREPPAGRRYPLLHKEYVTPAGTLSCSVRETDDWPYGDHVPFLDDYIEPRAEKFLVAAEADLPALSCLLAEPSAEEIARCREAWAAARRFAAERGLLVTGGWGVAAEAAAWLMGLTNAVLAAVDRPAFFEAFLEVVGRWNRRRMEVLLEAGVDLFIRRGWYEGTSFWSPALYRRFLLPGLKAEVELAHQAGARFGYVMSVGALQFAELLMEAGVDVVIGVEDVQDRGMDLAALKARVKGKMALWGGVNGFVTIERGDDEAIRSATVRAMATLGPDGFILSPVDNIRDPSAEVWRKVGVFIETWKVQARGTGHEGEKTASSHQPPGQARGTGD